MIEGIRDLGTAFKMVGELMRQALDRVLDWELVPRPQVGFTVAERFLIAVERARLEGTILLLTLDDGDLYEYMMSSPETYVHPKSTKQGIVMCEFRGVPVHMSFRSEDRTIYESF